MSGSLNTVALGLKFIETLLFVYLNFGPTFTVAEKVDPFQAPIAVSVTTYNLVSLVIVKNMPAGILNGPFEVITKEDPPAVTLKF